MSNKSNKNDSIPNQNLITLKQAVDLSGLSHSHLRLLVRSGEIEGKKLGRDWFTTEKAVNEYIASDHRPGPKTKS